MTRKAQIQFLRSGLITSLQGAAINNLQHQGITTSGPMDYFLSKIGNIILNNNKEDIGFEICKFGPKINILEGSFIFLISGNINFKIISNSEIITGECFKSYILNKGDILDVNETINSNYAYLVFKGKLDDKNFKNYSSTILSASIGINKGEKIYDLDRFTILDVPNFNNRKVNININDYYDKKIRVLKGPQMNFFKITDIKKFFTKKFKISKNLNRVGIRLIDNLIKPLISSNIPSEGIIKGTIQVPGDGNPIILAAEHPTIGGYPKIATIIIADFVKMIQLEEGSNLNFEEVDILNAEREYLAFKNKIENIKNNIVYL